VTHRASKGGSFGAALLAYPELGRDAAIPPTYVHNVPE
jgi:hypothetical protein